MHSRMPSWIQHVADYRGAGRRGHRADGGRNRMSETVAAPGEQILVIDDSPANIDLLARVLEPVGYRVLAAASGEAGVRVAERAAPDLILLDVVMPHLDGYEKCRRPQAAPSTRQIPVVFISARDETRSLVGGVRPG